jgi:hypothetical protein
MIKNAARRDDDAATNPASAVLIRPIPTPFAQVRAPTRVEAA